MDKFPVAVVMERRPLQGRWGGVAWQAVGVVPAFGENSTQTRPLVAEAGCEQFLVGGFALELFRDEAENYFLNISAPVPKVFVMWRLEDGAARPVVVTVSYGEAARMLDSGEEVDGVAMPREIADWVGDFVNTHYKPEPRKKIRRNDPLAQARGRA